MDISQVDCISLEKRSKQQVYILEVTYSNSQKHEIYRKYTSFFDFREKLKQKAKEYDVTIPEIGLKWFEKVGKASEKKRKQINEFCKAILQLPTEVSQCDAVKKFFDKWPSDNDPVADSNARASKDVKDKGCKKPEKLEKQRSSASDPFMKELTEKQKSKKNSVVIAPDIKENGNKPRTSSSTTPTNTDVALKPSLSRTDSSEATLKPSLSRTDSSDSLEEQYIVVEDFGREEDTHLDLKQGEIVLVVSKELTGWWLVHKESTGEEGWAPGGRLVPYNPNTTDIQLSDPEDEQEDLCGVYEAISDFKAKAQDEVTYKKSEHVEVLQMRTDGWWKVRNSMGAVGLAPAVNLARVSDGSASGPSDPLYSDITLYSQQSLYKKKTPPKRNPSHISLSELYAKVDRRPLAAGNQQLPKPKLRQQQNSLSEEPFYDNHNILRSSVFFEQNRPAVPPRPGSLTTAQVQENYVEVEFNQDNNSKFHIIGSENSTDYSEINPGHLLPKSTAAKHTGPPVYLNVRPEQENYENITPMREKKQQDDVFYELTKDYNPNMSHKEGMPATKGDIVKVIKEENPNVLCLMCLKERVEVGPSEGWIPSQFLRRISVEIEDYDSHGVPVITLVTPPPRASTGSTDHHVYGDVVGTTDSPVRMRAFWGSRKDKKGEWFVGQMSRQDCETLLTAAKSHEFVIRESKHGNEEYSVSVRYNDTVKHFKVEKQGEGKYQIGGFVFKNLSAIVKHYKKHALFIGDDKKSQMLGKAFVSGIVVRTS